MGSQCFFNQKKKGTKNPIFLVLLVWEGRKNSFQKLFDRHLIPENEKYAETKPKKGINININNNDKSTKGKLLLLNYNIRKERLAY